MNNLIAPATTSSGVIVGLKIANIQRLSAFEIVPKGNLIKIGGQNAQGKSSILDSIAMALGGSEEFSKRPIHGNEDHGSVVVELDDLVITRKFTRKDDGSTGTSLTVAGKNGAKFPSPQAVLDSLTGKLAFDPLEFMRLKPPQQREAVIKLCGIDTKDIDAKRKELAESRATNAKLLKQLGAPKDIDETIPQSEQSVDTLSAKLAEAIKHNGEVLTLRSVKAQAETNLHASNTAASINRVRIIELERELKSTREYLAANEAAIEVGKTDLAKADADIAAFKVTDTNALSSEIAGIGQKNATIRQAQKDREFNLDLKARATVIAALEDKVSALDNQRKALLDTASFPLEGMSFDEDGVIFNGQPLDQASDAEKIAISVAMGFSLNPTLRVLLIRNGSLLDDNMLTVVADMAAQAGGQVWIEMVGEREDCQVIIEDGAIKTLKP